MRPRLPPPKRMIAFRGPGIAALLVSAAVSVTAARAAAPPFSPITFFEGRTSGEGVFKRIAARRRTTQVTSTGMLTEPGTIVLRQHIVVAGKPPRDRTWVLRALGGGRFDGTLTDAIGPVRGEVRDGVFHVRFRTKGGLDVQQWMRPQPGGRVVLNHLVVRKFGIRVATLEETIRKLP